MTTQHRPHGTHHEGADPMNHTSSETPRWVVLTPEQVEALDQGVIVRAHRGDTTVQGPLMGLVGGRDPDVWISESRVKASERIEVRERDVPKPDPVDPILRPGDRVRLVDLDGREFHCTIRPAASQDSAAAVPDPQRLVSVRWDDLAALFAFYEPRWSHAHPQIVARVNAALRGETR